MRAKIKAALASTNIPVFWQRWKGEGNPPTRFFVFTTVNRPTNYADNAHKARSHYVYLELYSDTDYADVITSIRTGMASQGFWQIEERDVSETTQYAMAADKYHLSTTWSYSEAV